MVIDCEAVTELNALGEWGDITNSGDTNHPKKFTGVTNLIGIEYFYKLKKLDMSRHIPGDDFNSYGSYYPRLKPENINLQYNTELEWLDLNYANFNTISEVNNSHINGLTELRYLNFCNNFFKEFDMRPYKKLQRMQMAHNFDLTKIYAEPNDSLLELAIFDSMYGWENGYSLQSLIDNFKNLVFLHAFATPNEEVDLRQHTDLQSVWLLKSAYGADANIVYNGTYNIVCHHDPNLLFDCEGGKGESGTNVQLWDGRAATHHQFDITYVKTENNIRWYKIIAHHTTSKCVEASGSTPGNNANVQLWEYEETNNKLWTFRKNADGSYHIINKYNYPNLAIDVKDIKFEKGNNLQVYQTNDNQEAQKFALIPVALKITNEQAGSARQISKGPWLHKLDLSNNTKLRDIHVNNMHLASLNLNSEYIGHELEAPYNTWQVCREVSNLPEKLDGTSNVSPHEVIITNNYRHVNANYFKHHDKDGKWYTMFYLRTDFDGDYPESEAPYLLDNQTSFFETMTFDNYVDDVTKGNMSRKTFDISRTLADECFNGKRVLSAKKAVEIDNINCKGIMEHDEGSDELCIIKNYGSNIEVINHANSGVSQEFLDHISKRVKGTIIILQAYITDSEPETTPTDVPRAICYQYDMNSLSSTSAYNTSAKKVQTPVNIDTNNPHAPIIGTFFFDVHYPNIPLNEVVTGIEDIKVDNKEVAAVKYYNVAGVESNYPFMGINIAVITYTDGTRSSVKIVK